VTTALHVEVLLFAGLRELAGRRSLDVELAEPALARDAWTALTAACPRLNGSEHALRVAVNESYASWEAPLRDGDVVAFIPPVAGGAADPGGLVHVRMTTEMLDARALEAMVRTDADGAVCTFTGVVRDHADGRRVERLEYEAYGGMAEAELRRIAEETLRRFGATAIAVEHRTGQLGIGEASVVVSVSAPHRAEAFDACRWAMDTLKAEVPIWKKEFGEDGAVWVDEAARRR
jgi:molybdopterin synthase catalytic subunit